MAPLFTSSKDHTNQGSVRESLIRRIGRDPYVDWALIVSAALACVILLAVVDVSAYREVGQSLAGKDISMPATSDASPITLPLLDRTLGQFDARAQEYSSASHGYKGPSDPSL